MSKPLCFFIITALSFLFLRHGVVAVNSSSICFPSAAACGGVSIHYPFWVKSDSDQQYCGYPDFGLKCSDHGPPIITLPSDTYYVTHINYENSTLTLVDMDVVNQSCPRARHNVSLGSFPLSVNYELNVNLSFYFNCSVSNTHVDLPPNQISCLKNEGSKKSYVVENTGLSDTYGLNIDCEEVVVVVVKEKEIRSDELVSGFGEAMNKGFVLDWRRAMDCVKCEDSRGFCGYNNQTNLQMLCFCTDGSIATESCRKDEQFSACEPFNCGNITNLSYPFWSNSRPQFCGHPRFKLDCEGDNVTINMASKNFHVIDVHSNARTLTIARMDLWDTKCPKEFHNITLDYPFFNYTSNDVNSTVLYDCDPLQSAPNPVNLSNAMIFDCPINGNPRRAYFSLVGDRWFNKTTLGCRIHITVPVLGEAAGRFIEYAIDPGDVIAQGFEVELELIEEGQCEDCRKSGGRCGYDETPLASVSYLPFLCFLATLTINGHGKPPLDNTMNSHSRMLPYTLCNSFFFYLLFSTTILSQPLSQKEDDKFITCRSNYNCGNLLIPYPFWGGNRPHYCGRDGFEVACLSPDFVSIKMGSQNFTLIDFDPSGFIAKMVRTDIPNYDNRSFHFTNTSLDLTLFSLQPFDANMTIFYDCVPGFSIGRNNITCTDDRGKQAFFMDQYQLLQFPELVQHCGVQLQVPITSGVPVDPFGGIESLKGALDEGFSVLYLADWSGCSKCMESGGACGMKDDGSQFLCYCPDGSHDLACPTFESMYSFSVPSIIRPFNCSATCKSGFYSCFRPFCLLHRSGPEIT
ncbi:hypothetical protein K1719_030091 [Acacia pycnantha]|nr:hypothetical protein K1719_030091 [Acacia pycnantha]